MYFRNLLELKKILKELRSSTKLLVELKDKRYLFSELKDSPRTNYKKGIVMGHNVPQVIVLSNPQNILLLSPFLPRGIERFTGQSFAEINVPKLFLLPFINYLKKTLYIPLPHWVMNDCSLNVAFPVFSSDEYDSDGNLLPDTFPLIKVGDVVLYNSTQWRRNEKYFY